MNLKNLLVQKRSSILKKWGNVILQAYPEQGQSFMKKQKDRFANPVGRTVFEGIESIYDELLNEADSDNISLFLDNIIRVRAIQDMSPSQSVGFIFELKRIIKGELGSELSTEDASEEWGTLEAKIDGLALICFDIYTECRQKIYDIRISQVKNHVSGLLKMADLVFEVPESPENEGDLTENKANNG